MLSDPVAHGHTQLRRVAYYEDENDTDDNKSDSEDHIAHVSAEELDETLRCMKLELQNDLEDLLIERTSQKRDDQAQDILVKEKSKINPLSQAPVRKNSLHLIANSTICVFQWHKSWYRCFVCTQAFPDIDPLREHFSKHSMSDYEARIISQHHRLIKVEVSRLACKLCEAELPNLDDLLKHLDIIHSIPFQGNNHLLVPFKITTPLKCQLCGKEYESFRLLNMHVNKHYTSFVCDICGSTFSSRPFLNLHRSRVHRALRCEKCHLNFETRSAKSSHDRSEHGTSSKERFPCPKCESRFYQEVQRALHMVEEHGAPKPEHRCELCKKTFITRGLCNAHMSRTHRKERTHICDLCARLFYTRSDLARHRVTHTGERQFKCESCESSFATKGSLSRHVGRSHPSPKPHLRRDCEENMITTKQIIGQYFNY